MTDISDIKIDCYPKRVVVSHVGGKEIRNIDVLDKDESEEVGCQFADQYEADGHAVLMETHWPGGGTMFEVAA